MFVPFERRLLYRRLLAFSVVVVFCHIRKEQFLLTENSFKLQIITELPEAPLNRIS